MMNYMVCITKFQYHKKNKIFVYQKFASSMINGGALRKPKKLFQKQQLKTSKMN